jgi:tyrosinase
MALYEVRQTDPVVWFVLWLTLLCRQQALHGLIETIATLWPEGERERYVAAARRFRLPYWDWAATPPAGESVLPRSIGGNPFVDINGPNGQQRIANPLFSYSFKPLDSTAFGSGPVSTHTSHVLACLTGHG